jgi:hypothetical protein
MDVEEMTAEIEQLLASNCFGVQGELCLDVEPGVEATTLDNGRWPDCLDRFQHTLLSITDNVGWCWYERQQLSPVFVTFIRYPAPSNDVTSRPGNQADTTTNPDTVMVDLTRQGSQGKTRTVPAPSGFTPEGTG